MGKGALSHYFASPYNAEICLHIGETHNRDEVCLLKNNCIGTVTQLLSITADGKGVYGLHFEEFLASKFSKF